MSAFKARVVSGPDDPEGYIEVAIYAGADADHLQHAGSIMLRHEEVDEFITRINDPEQPR